MPWTDGHPEPGPSPLGRYVTNSRDLITPPPSPLPCSVVPYNLNYNLTRSRPRLRTLSKTTPYGPAGTIDSASPGPSVVAAGELGTMDVAEYTRRILEDARRAVGRQSADRQPIDASSDDFEKNEYGVESTDDDEEDDVEDQEFGAASPEDVGSEVWDEYDADVGAAAKSGIEMVSRNDEEYEEEDEGFGGSGEEDVEEAGMMSVENGDGGVMESESRRRRRRSEDGTFRWSEDETLEELFPTPTTTTTTTITTNTTTNPNNHFLNLPDTTTTTGANEEDGGEWTVYISKKRSRQNLREERAKEAASKRGDHGHGRGDYGRGKGEGKGNDTRDGGRWGARQRRGGGRWVRGN